VPAETDTPLLYVLRNDLGLNGAKFGCGLAQCGACTVLVDGRAARSCVTEIGAISPSTRIAFGPHSGNLPQGLGCAPVRVPS
jgi:aerobic-type carbon monoxide dehydrogenase small subunit (CoxS/CutS family)